MISVLNDYEEYVEELARYYGRSFVEGMSKEDIKAWFRNDKGYDLEEEE